MKQYYDFKNIFSLLTEGFSLGELKTMCFLEPALRPIYEAWPENASKADLARTIIDQAHQKLAIEAILSWAKENNPARYEAHQPYLAAEAAKDSPLALRVAENDLGYGIILGGEYQGRPLEVAATGWAAYGDTQVRSGWLFIPQLTDSHAVAFFKVHISDDGQGYIHIVDVANPAHNIRLTTQTGFRKEKEFHYVGHATDLWRFTWKSENNPFTITRTILSLND